MTNRTEILWLYGGGKTINFIAKHTKITPGTVRRHLREAGIFTRPGSKYAALARMAGRGRKNGQLMVTAGDPLLQALRKHYMEKDTCPTTTKTPPLQSRK